MSSLRLILMRHAKAETVAGADDHARPLSPRGRTEAGEAGRRLAALLRPDAVLSSDSTRTRETVAYLAPAWADLPSPRFTPALYGAPADAMLAEIRATSPDARSLLVVGHNPGVGDLARRLAGEGEAADLAALAAGFPTASFAVVGFEAGGWADLAVAGRLEALLRADERSGR